MPRKKPTFAAPGRKSCRLRGNSNDDQKATDETVLPVPSPKGDSPNRATNESGLPVPSLKDGSPNQSSERQNIDNLPKCNPPDQVPEIQNTKCLPTSDSPNKVSEIENPSNNHQSYLPSSAEPQPNFEKNFSQSDVQERHVQNDLVNLSKDMVSNPSVASDTSDALTGDQDTSAKDEEREKARIALQKRCDETRRALSGGMTREEWKVWQWNEATARNEARGRAQKASGEVEYFRPKPKPKVNIESMTEEELQQHRLKERKHKLYAMSLYYNLEEKLVTAYLEIKVSLTKEDPQVDKVIRILKAVHRLYIPRFMILNNPQMMTVLCKLRNYRPDARIRHIAKQVFNKFCCMFLLPEHETFMQHFRRQVAEQKARVEKEREKKRPKKKRRKKKKKPQDQQGIPQLPKGENMVHPEKEGMNIMDKYVTEDEKIKQEVQVTGDQAAEKLDQEQTEEDADKDHPNMSSRKEDDTDDDDDDDDDDFCDTSSTTTDTDDSRLDEEEEVPFWEDEDTDLPNFVEEDEYDSSLNISLTEVAAGLFQYLQNNTFNADEVPRPRPKKRNLDDSNDSSESDCSEYLSCESEVSFQVTPKKVPPKKPTAPRPPPREGSRKSSRSAAKDAVARIKSFVNLDMQGIPETADDFIDCENEIEMESVNRKEEEASEQEHNNKEEDSIGVSDTKKAHESEKQDRQIKSEGEDNEIEIENTVRKTDIDPTSSDKIDELAIEHELENANKELQALDKVLDEQEEHEDEDRDDGNKHTSKKDVLKIKIMSPLLQRKRQCKGASPNIPKTQNIVCSPISQVKPTAERHTRNTSTAAKNASAESNQQEENPTKDRLNLKEYSEATQDPSFPSKSSVPSLKAKAIAAIECARKRGRSPRLTSPVQNACLKSPKTPKRKKCELSSKSGKGKRDPEYESPKMANKLPRLDAASPPRLLVSDPLLSPAQLVQMALQKKKEQKKVIADKDEGQIDRNSSQEENEVGESSEKKNKQEQIKKSRKKMSALEVSNNRENEIAEAEMKEESLEEQCENVNNDQIGKGVKRSTRSGRGKQNGEATEHVQKNIMHSTSDKSTMPPDIIIPKGNRKLRARGKPKLESVKHATFVKDLIPPVTETPEESITQEHYVSAHDEVRIDDQKETKEVTEIKTEPTKKGNAKKRKRSEKEEERNMLVSSPILSLTDQNGIVVKSDLDAKEKNDAEISKHLQTRQSKRTRKKIEENLPKINQATNHEEMDITTEVKKEKFDSKAKGDKQKNGEESLKMIKQDLGSNIPITHIGKCRIIGEVISPVRTSISLSLCTSESNQTQEKQTTNMKKLDTTKRNGKRDFEKSGRETRNNPDSVLSPRRRNMTRQCKSPATDVEIRQVRQSKRNGKEKGNK